MSRTVLTALVFTGLLATIPVKAEPIRALHTTTTQSAHSHQGKLIALTTFGKSHYEVAPNLVLLPVDGPVQVELDPSVVYKFKSHQEDPTPSEFQYLSGALQRTLQAHLRGSTGGGAVRWQDTSAGRESVTDVRTAGKRVGARYVLSTTIEEVRFEGNVLLGPWYQMRVSSKLFDGNTGTMLWHMSNKKFENFHKVDAGKRPAQIMEEILLPKVAEHVNREVTLATANSR